MKPRKSSRELLAVQTSHGLKMGKRFVHYDAGELVEVLVVGFWEPTAEPCVTYRGVDSGVNWTRLLAVFLEQVTPADGGPTVARFAPLEGKG